MAHLVVFLDSYFLGVMECISSTAGSITPHLAVVLLLVGEQGEDVAHGVQGDVLHLEWIDV